MRIDASMRAGFVAGVVIGAQCSGTRGREGSPLAMNRAKSQPFAIVYSLAKSQRPKGNSHILGLIPGRAR